MKTLIGLILTLLTGLFILLGSLIVIKSKNKEKIVDFSISLGFTVMLGLILLELLPEAMMHLNNYIYVILFIALGLLLLKILDIFIPEHNENLNHLGIVSSIALIIHNLIEGIAILGVTLTEIHLGILLSIGVGLHNIPMGMIITTSIKNNKRLIILPLLALSTLIGGLLASISTIFVNEFILGIFLAITLGMLLYISIFELLPKMKNKPNILGIIIGIILIVLTLCFHHH